MESFLAIGALMLLVFGLALLFLFIIPTWKIFTKAGEAGWKSIVPIYNTYVMVIIAGLPWWVFLGFFIPVINIAAIIATQYYLSQRFGYGMGYALGMIFLPFIFYPILGYGNAVYTQPLSVNTEPVPSNPTPAPEATQ